jgi:hypothetical protein
MTQQKQKRSKRMIPAMTPITIPAIAPGLSPLLLLEVIGRVLPLAVAGGVNETVVVAETTAVDVKTLPLVGSIGAPPAADVAGVYAEV